MILNFMKKLNILTKFITLLLFFLFQFCSIIQAERDTLDLGPVESPGGWNPETIATGDNEKATGTLEKVISMLIGVVTTLSSMFFIIQLFRAGLNYITAGGDSGKIEAVKLRMQQSAIGLGIVVMIYSVLGIIGKVMGINILYPGQTLLDIIGT